MAYETVSKLDILEAFKKFDGNLKASADSLGLHPQTIYNYMGQDEDLENKLLEFRRGSKIRDLDIAVSVIRRVQQMVETKTGYALDAAKYVLERHGKKWGYGNYQEDTDTSPNEKEVSAFIDNMRLQHENKLLKDQLNAYKSQAGPELSGSDTQV